MDQIISDIRNLLNEELSYVNNMGIKNLGYRYFLPNGKSFGCPTENAWYTSVKTNDFYNNMSSYLTKELLYLTTNNFTYVTRAGDHRQDAYLNWLRMMKLDNSVGIYKFSPHRIDSFFFICQSGEGKQRDILINNIDYLEKHASSLVKKINAHLSEKLYDKTPEFILEKNICQKIFKNVLAIPKISSKSITVVLDGQKIMISCRELDVLKSMRFGESTKEIANKLGVSIKTIEKQISSLKSKFCVNSKMNLVKISHSPCLKPILKINYS